MFVPMIKAREPAPVVELIRFTPKEPYLSNASEAIGNFAKILTETNGCISVFHGLELEQSESGSKRGMIFVLWQTLEDHQALRSAPDTYRKLGLAFRDVAEDISVFHVYPKCDPSSCFAANALEVSLMKFKTGHSGSDEDIVGPLDELMAYEAPEHVGKPTWGQVYEEKQKVVLFVGWESVEAHAQVQRHDQAVAMARKVFGRIGKYLEGSVETKHVKLSKYSPNSA